MIASRTNGPAAAFLSLMVLALPAWAQTDTPIATAPPQALEAAPVQQPAEPEAPAAVVREFQPGMQQSSTVQVGALGRSEGGPAGLLDESNGGLGETLWSGSSRADVIGLLEKLPLRSPAPSLRDLARRLLLTRAEAPSGPSDKAFLTARLKKMLEGGMVEEAAIIAANARIADDAGFARAQADAILIAGHGEAACGDATALRLSSAEPFWIELRAYCYWAAGDSDMYDLTRTVMSAQDLSDGVFDILFDDVRNGTKDIPDPIDNLTALHLFLMKRAGIPVDAVMLARLGVGAAIKDSRPPPLPASDGKDTILAVASALASGIAPPDDALARLPTLADAANPEGGHAALLLGLTRAMGMALPKRADESLNSLAATAWPGRRPAPVLMDRIAQARHSGSRRGEALLTMLVAIGSRGPGDLAPDVTLQLVQLLKDIGPSGSADAFARDAILLYRAPQWSNVPPAPTQH